MEGGCNDGAVRGEIPVASTGMTEKGGGYGVRDDGVRGGWLGGWLEDDLEFHEAGFGDGEDAEASWGFDGVVGQDDFG